jgi:hypothetical protein
MIRLTASVIYAAAMTLTGLGLALASLAFPVIHDGPVPPLMALIAISLLFDMALMSAASRGRIDLLQMNGRMVGFFAGALIYLGARLLLA